MWYIFTVFQNSDALIAVFMCLEPGASRMHLWQGTRKLKYQNENINKPGPK